MKIRNQQSRSPLWWLGAGVLTAIAVPLLLTAAGSRNEGQAAYRRQIEQMSPGQRDRLEENLRQFQHMSESERDTLRALDRQIAEAPDADQLRGTLAQYERWLATLSPFQRQQLRNTRDLKARLELAREFKRQQAGQSPDPHDLAGDFPPAELLPELETMPPLKPAELNAMLEAAAKHLGFSEAELQDLTPLKRNLYVLNRAVHRAEEGRPGPGSFFRWLDDELMAAMLEALPEGEFRRATTLLGSIKEVKQRTLAASILDAARRQIQHEVTRRMSREELSRLWRQLTPEERRLLERLNPEEKRRWFFRRAMAKVSDDMPELRSLMQRLFIGRGGPRRGEEGRPGSRSERPRGIHRRPRSTQRPSASRAQPSRNPRAETDGRRPRPNEHD